MKIIVLDGYTVNPCDLSWDGLKDLGECTFYDRTSPDELIVRSIDTAVILTNKVVLSSDV